MLFLAAWKGCLMSKNITHPGVVLAQRLHARDVSPAELARQIGVPANRISQILNGKRAISGDTALRLAHWFGTSPEYWLHLQAAFDLEIARRSAGLAIESLPTHSEHRATGHRSRPLRSGRGQAAVRRHG